MVWDKGSKDMTSALNYVLSIIAERIATSDE